MDNSQPQPQQPSTGRATINLAGKDYDFDSLSEPAKQLVGALRASESEIRSLRNQLALMDMGRRALVSQLRLAVENPEAFNRLQETSGSEAQPPG